MTFGTNSVRSSSLAPRLDAAREGHELGRELGEAQDLAAQLAEDALAPLGRGPRAGLSGPAVGRGLERRAGAAHQIEAHREAVERVLHLVRDRARRLAEEAEALLAHRGLLALPEELERAPEQERPAARAGASARQSPAARRVRRRDRAPAGRASSRGPTLKQHELACPRPARRRRARDAARRVDVVAVRARLGRAKSACHDALVRERGRARRVDDDAVARREHGVDAGTAGFSAASGSAAATSIAPSSAPVNSPPRRAAHDVDHRVGPVGLHGHDAERAGSLRAEEPGLRRRSSAPARGTSWGSA